MNNELSAVGHQAIRGSSMSRESIDSGEQIASFELPSDARWSREKIEKSLLDTLRSRPEEGPLWIFAYGSMMWNPMIHFDRFERATLDDWHRSFCLRFDTGSSTPGSSGRMLALEPGGVTYGAALRLSNGDLVEGLRMLWTREMRTGSHRPTWLPITLHGGTKISALAFVADQSQAQYSADASVPTVAALMAGADGEDGTNAEYVFMLENALAKEGLADTYIRDLANRLRRLGAAPSTHPTRLAHPAHLL